MKLTRTSDHVLFKNDTTHFYVSLDFCNSLGLDLDREYEIEDLNKIVTIDVLKEYSDECVKVFGKNIFKYLGGVLGILNEDTIDLVLRSNAIPEKDRQVLACKFARQCLPIFENRYPTNDRPRKAIEAKEAWIEGDITDVELAKVRSAVKSKNWSEVSSTADEVESARLAANLAAWLPAESAELVAKCAAWSMKSVTREDQVKIIKEHLLGNGKIV